MVKGLPQCADQKHSLASSLPDWKTKSIRIEKIDFFGSCLFEILQNDYSSINISERHIDYLVMLGLTQGAWQHSLNWQRTACECNDIDVKFFRLEKDKRSKKQGNKHTNKISKK